MWSGLFGENRKDLGLGSTTVQVCSALSQAWNRKWEAPTDPLGPGNGASGAGMLGSSSVLMLGALLTSLLPHPHPTPKMFQRRMETLNLRWEELGVKEAQLKAHIQKFEQFIQV